MAALAAVAVLRVVVDPDDEPGEATTVREVADQAVDVAESLDISGGTALLCEAPIDLYRQAVESTVVRWQSLSGEDLPAVEAGVEDVDSGPEGSFVLRVDPESPELDGEERAFRVFVQQRGSRSCVVGVGGPRAERPTTRFSRGGYQGVTSPTPRPTPTPTPTPTAP